MDQTVDPCDDFFEYACGSWNRQNYITSGQTSINVFQKLDHELQATLQGEK
jgi:predicted metalloendopeptidase